MVCFAAQNNLRGKLLNQLSAPVNLGDNEIAVLTVASAVVRGRRVCWNLLRVVVVMVTTALPTYLGSLRRFGMRMMPTAPHQGMVEDEQDRDKMYQLAHGEVPRSEIQ